MALYSGASFILDSPYCINTLLTPTASAAAFGHRKMQAFFCDTHLARFFWRFWTKIEPDFEQNTIKDRNSRNYGLSYLQ